MTALAESHQLMAAKAKTFRWAALFLDRERADDAATLYAFCRAADDAADESPDPDRGRAQLDWLERGLDGDGPAVSRDVVELAHRRSFSLDAARELLAGVRGDLAEVKVTDDAELARYAYLVAGTVGLMMSAILGARDERALRPAIELGIGMQITNICRDVAEDAARGRVYLPASRLEDAGTSADEILAGTAAPERVARVVSGLLELAEGYYERADAGMAYLPARARLVVLMASRMYRGIGRKLRASGCDALQGRVVLSAGAKVALCLAAAVSWVVLTVRRYRAPVAPP